MPKRKIPSSSASAQARKTATVSIAASKPSKPVNFKPSKIQPHAQDNESESDDDYEMETMNVDDISSESDLESDNEMEQGDSDDATAEEVDDVKADNESDRPIKKQKVERDPDGPSRHVTQKTLKLTRQSEKPNFEIIQKLKLLWEALRKKELTKEKRADVLKEIMALVEGKVVEVTLKHDASRIIQSMLKYANAEQRFKISSELKGRFKDLANGKYGGFVVEKILKYCPSLRPIILSEFQSHASRLILHLSTSLIINSLYTTYCTPVQRTALIQELYHPSFTHFKDAEYKSFKDVMKKEEWKAGALKHSLNIVQKVCEKGLLGSLDIVQRLAGEVIEVLGETDDADKLQNLLTTLSPQLLPSLHTKPGSYLTQLCILHGTPKIRKNILKSFKGYIPKIAAEEYGYAVLLRVFDCVDDTVMVSKTILNELLNEPQLLFNDTHALKVTFYLLSPRHPKYTPSHVLSSFKESDHIRSQTSKKDNYQRSRELLKAADDKILKYLCDLSDTELMKLLQGEGDGGVESSWAVVEVLMRCGNAKHVGENENDEEGSSAELQPLTKQLIESIVRCATLPQDDTNGESSDQGVISHPTGSRTIKSIISYPSAFSSMVSKQASKLKSKSQSEEIIDCTVELYKSQEAELSTFFKSVSAQFSNCLLSSVDADKLYQWCITPQAVFTVVALLESQDDTVTLKAKKMLEGKKKGIEKKKGEVKGVELLLGKL